MKIASWNVNGIRACIKKGFWEWFENSKADVVCLQEMKITEKDFAKIATEHDLTPLHDFSDPDLFEEERKRKKPIYFALACAEKAGYSGVAIFSKIKPKGVQVGWGIDEFDREGRTIFAEYDDFLLVTSYVPNGGRDLSRIPYKMAYSDELLKYLQKERKRQKNIILCGDMNVAHTEIDIKNPKTNVNNSGFTQIERDWFSKFLDHDYIDTFRHLNPDKRDIYTWWSYRPGVRQRNVGWRIDYFAVTGEMISKVKSSTTQMEQMGSDHCPIFLSLK